MARLSYRELPEKNDLVIGVVKSIKKHGIYMDLKEYEDVEGYCHISEIAGTFIRNIRNFVKIGEMRVAKVQRVDENKKQVDVSLKRVSDQLKRDKMQQYKQQNAAAAMIHLISEKTGKKEDDILDEIEEEMIKSSGSLYHGFEEVAALEEEAFDNINIPEEFQEIILEVAKASIQISTVPITATLGLRSFANDGVEQVKQLLLAAEDKAKEFKEVDYEITTVGAPHYRIFLEARTYDEVNEAYEGIENRLKEASETLDVEYKLERKKR